jgi:uncharacterized membrane protein YjgN (DUF898 family)
MAPISVDSAVMSIRKGHIVAIVTIAILIGTISNLTAHLLLSGVNFVASRPWLKYTLQVLLLAVEVTLLIVVLRVAVK